MTGSKKSSGPSIGPMASVVAGLAVTLLTIQGFVINRAAGIENPVWAPHGAK